MCTTYCSRSQSRHGCSCTAPVKANDLRPSNSVDVGVQFLPRIFKITPDTYSMQHSAFVPRACDEIGPRS
ncbi:Uncharacterized protein HZ326_23191 [Fusarium oxysporum f. sp. albedinis]|nr:Uncharacterized protein HZ326_23191 [Fusarium oxysporum f. sp. albedinis]